MVQFLACQLMCSRAEKPAGGCEIGETIADREQNGKS